MSRLLLVVDYLLHFFYDLPPALIDQVRSFSGRYRLAMCVYAGDELTDFLVYCEQMRSDKVRNR